MARMNANSNNNDDNGNPHADVVDPAVLLPLLVGLSRSGLGCSTTTNNTSSSSSSRASIVANAKKAMRSKDETMGDDDEKMKMNEEVEGGAANNAHLFWDNLLLSSDLTFPAKLHRLLSIVAVPPSTTMTTSEVAAATTASTSTTIRFPPSSNDNDNNKSYYSHILSWSTHGRSWIIHDPLALETSLLSQYFDFDFDFEIQKERDGDAIINDTATANDDGGDGGGGGGRTRKGKSSKMELFQRELNRWGFRKCHDNSTCSSSSGSSSSGSRGDGEEEDTSRGGVVDQLEYYHPEFLRCHFDKVHNMRFNEDIEENNEGKENATSTNHADATTKEHQLREGSAAASAGRDDKDANDDDDEGEEEEEEGDDDEEEETVEQITNFMAVTGSDSAIVARQYLEMSGNHLETAISLFLDHGGVGITGASATAGGGEDTAMTEIDQGSGGNIAMEDAYPNFDALPPMPPLSSPLNQVTTTTAATDKVSPAEHIVESALREYCAFRTVRRALLTFAFRRRKTPRDVEEERQAPQHRSKEEGIPSMGVVPTTRLPHDALAAASKKKKLNYLSHGPSHFLFQSLLHPSLPVRRAAARMILHNFHRVQQRDHNIMKKTKKKKNVPVINRSDLQEVLIILLHGLMFGEAPYSQQQHQERTMIESAVQPNHHQQYWSSLSMHHPMIPCFKNQSDGGDPALQIMGLLVSLVCDGGFSNILVCNELKEQFHNGTPPSLTSGPRSGAGSGVSSGSYLDTGSSSSTSGTKDEDSILARTLLRDLSSDCIESFVAGGGLRWACGCILRLAHMLVHGSTTCPTATGSTPHYRVGTNCGGDYSDGDSRNFSHHGILVDPMDDITSCTIQSRMLLLIDLVYRLVLYGSVPAAVDRLSSGLCLSKSKEDEMGSSSKGSVRDNNDKIESMQGNSSNKQALRTSTRELYDVIPRYDGSGSVVSSVAASGARSVVDTDRTARTSLLQRLASRSSMGIPSSLAGGNHSRPICSKRSHAKCRDNSGAPSFGAGGGTRGGTSHHGPSVSVLDENRRRKDTRRATLERVNKLFWSSNLPAAICVPSDRSKSTADYGMKSGDSPSTVAAAESAETTSACLGHLSSLACLIAAYEILRSRPVSHATLSTNSRLRALEKGIAVLGRIVDPIASNALVVVENELPWELAEKLLGDEYGKKALAHGIGAGDHGVKEGCTVKRCAGSNRKRSRSSSHDGHRSRSSSAPTELIASTTRSSPSRITSEGYGDELCGGRGMDSSPSAVGHRTKRTRLASSNVTSVLERLTRVEATTSGGVAEVGGSGSAASLHSNTTRSGIGLAAARAESVLGAGTLPVGGIEGGEQSSNSASRYQSATESMRRFSAVGTCNNSAPVAAAAVTSRNERDGSLSRLLALGGGPSRALGSAGVASSSNIRSGSSHSVSTAASLAMPAASRSLMREDWRILHELPDGGDVMDIDDDVAYLSNVDDDEEEYGNIDDEEVASEEGNGNSDDDDDEDSNDESVFEVDHPGRNNDVDHDEGNDVDQGDDNSGSEDEDPVIGGKVYDEETDDDTSQFDDAVINLEDINLTTSTGTTRCEFTHHGQHPIRNPHRQSLSRNPSSSQLGIGVSSSLETARGNVGSSKGHSAMSAATKREREQAYVTAAMSILAVQYPGLPVDTTVECVALVTDTGQVSHYVSSSNRGHSLFAKPCTTIGPPLLTSDSEQSLLKSLCNIVKPPRKPLNLKIFLRRAPTQEEYFRGSLSRNPIGLSSLRAACAASGAGGGGSGVSPDERRTSSGGVGPSGSNDEPLVSDLRMHIAKDLQMEDSSELLELLVANKILDMNLKLRVVQQVLWRRYVEENATSASSLGVAGAGPSHQMISTGNGLNMIFSSSGLVAARNRVIAGGSGSVIGSDESAMLESFPPMVVTYRLAGVDGEATEDKVELEDLEDPEAPSTASLSPSETEQRMEKEFGITRMMLSQRNGVALLLENIECTISDYLRRMRRDEVARRRLLRSSSCFGVETALSNEYGNGTREYLAKAPPCSGLILLRHCANLSENRKMMLANRAPTLLLRILLDILNAMNKSSETSGCKRARRGRSSTFDSSANSMEIETAGAAVVGASAAKVIHHVEGNPTTDALQEIIEMLASDISSEISDGSKSFSLTSKNTASSGSFVNLILAENRLLAGVGEQQDADRTLPLVLKSLHSTELSPPLRKVIAKLLPFLTYGRVSQSRELASYFCKYINVNRLGMIDEPPCSEEQERHQQGNTLMTTFVEAAINLPPVPVCDNLRKELLCNGFVECVRSFLLEGAPTQPPSWSPALYSVSSEKLKEYQSSDSMERWRNYLNRPGLSQAFKILMGLCSRHVATQLYLSGISSDGGAEEASPCEDFNFLMLCHWMESTSDNTASNLTNPCGILAETLLDALKEDNESSSMKIDTLRRKTRDRKRKLAEERRNKALGGICVFGTYTEQGTLSSSNGNFSGPEEVPSDSRSMIASMFSSFLSPSSLSSQPRTRASVAKESTTAIRSLQRHKALPSWMAEMEALADEAGVTCAVCQEGRSLQPSELLGIYAYMKKVTIPSSQGGGRGDVDGSVLLLSLPATFPNSSMNTSHMEALFARSRQAANALEGTSHALSAMASSTCFPGTGGSGGGSRTNYYVTTVSAGNAIHCSCHKKAKAADRNHPKAPKSEWEGANLRNSRVACNVILPLVSSKTSIVPLITIETAMAEYNTIVTNTLGTRPKSILWNCLHDIRFLLLRMVHGEALGADCGGGSSSSNFLLLMYQLHTADFLAKNAEHDESLEISRHAKGLSAGFLVGLEIVDDPNFDRIDSRSRRLERGVAIAAPMAALLSILFFNSDDTPASTALDAQHQSCSETKRTPSPTRQWEVHKSKFLSGLIRCAGHRHSLGLADSGCLTSRGISTGRRNIEKARSFIDWSNDDDVSSGKKPREVQRTTMIDDYSRALRPMITLYAIFDQLSKEFFVDNDDERTQESSERLAAKLELCHKADSIHELLRVAEIRDEDDAI